MLKKYVIISVLLLAYTIVLGHSIIPHHHHHQIDHESKMTKHHHHNHESNQQGNNDDGLSHDLGNYFHSGETQDVYQQTDVKVSFNVISTVYLFTEFNFYIKADENPPIVRCSSNYIPILLHCISSKGLRAPPCYLV